MRNNINKVSERGERLDSLQDKTDNLAVSAQGFRRGANRVRKQMWWKDMKMRMCLIIGIILLLVIIIVPSGMPTTSSLLALYSLRLTSSSRRNKTSLDRLVRDTFDEITPTKFAKPLVETLTYYITLPRFSRLLEPTPIPRHAPTAINELAHQGPSADLFLDFTIVFLPLH